MIFESFETVELDDLDHIIRETGQRLRASLLMESLCLYRVLEVGVSTSEAQLVGVVRGTEIRSAQAAANAVRKRRVLQDGCATCHPLVPTTTNDLHGAVCIVLLIYW